MWNLNISRYITLLLTYYGSVQIVGVAADYRPADQHRADEWQGARNRRINLDSPNRYRAIQQFLKIKSILSKLMMMKRHNITPVFVFDGTPPALKRRTLEDRSRKRFVANEQ